MRQNHLSPALLCGVAAAVPAACAAQPGAGGRGSGRPNIVYIMTDDHAYQTVGAYGHPISRLAPTPNIDRLAREGMLFREAFVENSISAPSRATLLTGVYSHRHGQTTLSYGIMDTTLVHFPELLRAEGYLTAIFGKWHLSVEPKGFDHYDLLWDQGEYYNPVMRTPETGGRYVRQEGYATDIITDHALAWLDARRDDDAPFCLMIHHKAPHRNWMADLKYLDLYEDVEFPEPETLFDDYATRGDQMRQQQLTIDRHMGYAFDFKVEELKDEPTLQYIHDSWDIAMSTLTPEQRRVWDDSYGRKNRDFLADRPEGKELLRWKYQRYIHDYCRTIRSVDDQIGRVLDYLEENGLMDNTLIVYTSDQGFLLGEHGLYDKRFMYEESFRTPLIMAWRGHIRPGTVCRELVQNIDYAPTLLDAAGVGVPDGMDGVSLQPLFRSGKARGWRTSLYYQYYDYPAVGSVRAHYGIRTDRYKLIHWFGPGADGDPDIDFWELYDLRKDPCEVHNVYEERGYLPIRRELARLLAEKRGELGIRKLVCMAVDKDIRKILSGCPCFMSGRKIRFHVYVVCRSGRCIYVSTLKRSYFAIGPRFAVVLRNGRCRKISHVHTMYNQINVVYLYYDNK